MIVTEQDLERAISILEFTETKMAKTFSGVGKLASADVMTKVMNDVGMAGNMLFSELLDKYKNDIDKWGLEKVIESLQAMKFIKREVLEDDVRLYYHKDKE